MSIKPNFLKRLISKNSNEEILLSEQQYRAAAHELIENIDQVVFQIDILGKWVFLNHSWEILTGFSIEECLGSNYLNYIHPNDRDICNQSMIGILNQRKNIFHNRIRFLTKDENYFWADIHANKSENEAAYIVGSFANVTDQAHEAGLSYATHRSLSTLIDNLNGLVYRGRNDHDWSMEFISAGCYKLTGYRPEDLLNKSVTFASLIHPQDRENVWNEVQSSLNDHSICELIYRITDRHGEEKWVWESSQGNFSSSGELLGLEGFITDITSWKKNYIRTLHDGLYVRETEFPRRRLFMDRLKCAVTRSKKIEDFNFALFVIQIDRFNKLQNRYDETTCESIRENIAKLFYDVIEPLDTICLLKEDVFGILVEHINSLHDITQFAQRIHDIFTSPLDVEDSSLFLTVSIGITTNSSGYQDYNVMLRDANTALIRAKVLGGACHEIFDEQINIKVSTLYKMEKELQHAIDNREIQLQYQPIIALKDNSLAGFEVKLIWNQPRKGNIDIENFISLAKNQQIIEHVNEHIIEGLSEELHQWLKTNEFKAPLLINLQFFGSPSIKKHYIEKLHQQLLSQVHQYHHFALLLSSRELNILHREDNDLFETLRSINIKICLNIDLVEQLDTKILANSEYSIVKISTPQPEQGLNENTLKNATVEFMHNLGKSVIAANLDTNMEDVVTLKPFQSDFVQGDSIEKPIDSELISEVLSRYSQNKQIDLLMGSNGNSKS